MHRLRGLPAVEHQIAQSGVYTDPLQILPFIEEPELDTSFRGPAAQMTDRASSLVELAETTIIEHGAPSAVTDYWLAVARQNLRRPVINEFYYTTEDQAKLSMIGLKALYLNSDPGVRESPEAYVHTTRVAKGAQAVESGDYYGRPRTNPFKEALTAFDAIDEAQPELATYFAQLGEQLGLEQHSPELAYAKSHALFGYASTIADCPEKESLLKESLVYANYAFTGARDETLKGASLRILGGTIHDISYMPHSFSVSAEGNTRLVVAARNYAVTLLRMSIAKLEAAHPGEQPQIDVHTVLSDAKYFEYLYSGHIAAQDMYTARTSEIRTYIATETARKFGKQAVIYTLPAPNESPQVLAA